MHKKFLLPIVGSVAAMLIGCAQLNKQPEYWAPVVDRGPAPDPLVATLSAQIRDAQEWEAQQTAALNESHRVARITVRNEKITDHAKCSVIPAALKQYVLFPRFQWLMQDQYRGKCLALVDRYRTEQAAEAKKKAKK